MCFRMERYYAKKDASNSNTGNKETESRLEQKRPRIELDLRDIVDDPGNRKPIDEFHHDIRDEARRAYLQKGPYRPTGHKFKLHTLIYTLYYIHLHINKMLYSVLAKDCSV